MSWQECVIATLKGKGNLETALKTAVTVEPDELFSLIDNYQDAEYTLGSAIFLNELAVVYWDAHKFSEAERALKRALEKCRGLAGTSPDRYTYECVKALINLGNLYSTTGQFSQAEPLFMEALEMVKRISKPSEVHRPDIAVIFINLGNLYRDTQKFLKAETAYQKALQTMRYLAGKTPEYTADVALILMNLGLLYWETKQFVKAEKAYREAVEKYRDLASHSPVYLFPLARTLTNLGILYQNTQQFSEAEEILREALEKYQEVEKSADCYVGIADTLDNLGNLYWYQKKFCEAEKVYKESLKMRRELAKRNPDVYTRDVVVVLNNLGNLYRDTQQFSEAESAYRESLEMCRAFEHKNPEVYNPYKALVLNNMGVLYMNMQQIDKAEERLNEALQIRRELEKRNPGVYAVDVAMTLNNMGLFLKRVGRFSDAKNVYGEALEIYWHFERENPGAFVSDIARTLDNLGTLHGDIQEWSEAENVFRKALHMYEELSKGDSRVYALDVAGTFRNLGTLYRDTKRFDKAEKAYHEALKIYLDLEKENPDAHRPHVASLLNDLGIFYQDTRKFYESEKAYREALERREELVRKDSAYAADLAGTYNNLGNLYNDISVYSDKKRFDEAEKVYKEALRVFETLSEESPEVFTPHVAGMLNNLGALYKDKNQYKEAEKVHKKSLSLRMKLANENPEAYMKEVADSLTSLGIVYERVGSIREAEKYYREAFEKYVELGLWFDAANSCYNLSQAKSDRRLLDKARRLFEIAVLLSGEKKYTYAQKGTYESIYWGLLQENVSSFSVLETLRDPELLSLPWEYILSDEKLEKAQEDMKYQKKMVEVLLKDDIPSVKILEQLPKHSLFIYVQDLRDYVLFFVMGNDSIQRVECEKEFLTIGDKLLFNLQIQRGSAQKTDDLSVVIEKFDDLSKKWSEILPGEIKRLIQENNYIIFSPDSYCSYFPLEALQIDGEPLCIEKTVVRATSVHQFSRLPKKKPHFDSSLIVGNPWAGYKKERLIYSLPSVSMRFEISFLEGAEEEANVLARKLPHATVLLEKEASGEKLLSEISRHSLIHYSGHGSLGRILFLSGPFKGFPPSFEPEEFSDLRKAQRHDKTRKINMMEEWHPVTDLDLFDVELTDGAVIFLNACETGQHKYAGGGYYQGLPAVFLKNGAHSIISSLVPIFDKHSKDFATHFYETLLQTHSVAKSLKKARVWIRDKYKAHIYWIPYIHYGPPL